MYLCSLKKYQVTMKNLFKIILALIFIASGCKTSRDASKSEIVGIQSDGITEKYWKLIELNGNPVVFNDSTSREPFIILKDDNIVNGNGGCNTISGAYEIDRAASRIKFSQIVSTMMACINMEFEDGLKRALETADNYSLSADGKYLSLNRARMAPLARFEVVYLR